ncbi:FtsW/RodA/SpoVE family cell cycle protein [Selenomonas sp. FOBRC6]|uniref:FtsW/RodA/SpoVE family cell cycle protein n=1 Tax=Selenomonas sp. FOBRC6 TaxID=936572 RepID=UPI0002782940|nr:FtsW/RodA/SpoVE family cell cycle protein [Selenomonas sp. FOBRC6]EJO17765.1 cell cycle protein, FtsW/RodA/SpoVE family [Selenomonas sp. FOBRC6]
MTAGLKFAPVGLLLCALGVLFLKQGAGQAGWVFDWHTQLAYLPWLALLICAGAASYVLAAQRRLDSVPLSLAYLLLAVGLAEIARLKPELFTAQLRWACVGIAFWALTVVLWERLRNFLAYPYVLGIATTIILLLPLLFGVSIGGNTNWLAFGGFSVQPSEFGKILLIFFLAAYLADHRAVLTLPARRFLFLHLPPVRFIAPLVVLWGLAVLMFVIARDLGAALLFFGMAVLMTYMGTGRKSYVFLAGLFILVAAALSYALFGHVRVRFDIWLHPWADPNGMSYQVVQSLFAIGTGGIWGTGFAEGHPLLIPEVHTDFIFAAIAEEFGLIGAVFVLMCYALLFWRGSRIAMGVPRAEESLLAAGCAASLLLQAFIITAGVTKLLPLTGITLPFVSYGGSSMSASFILVGILTALSGERRGAADG